MNQTLLNEFRGEQDDKEVETEESKSEISVDRLEKLLQRVNLDPTEHCDTQFLKELTPEEKKDFDLFVSGKQAQQALEVWEPWWNYRQ